MGAKSYMDSENKWNSEDILLYLKFRDAFYENRFLPDELPLLVDVIKLYSKNKIMFSQNVWDVIFKAVENFGNTASLAFIIDSLDFEKVPDSLLFKVLDASERYCFKVGRYYTDSFISGSLSEKYYSIKKTSRKLSVMHTILRILSNIPGHTDAEYGFLRLLSQEKIHNILKKARDSRTLSKEFTELRKKFNEFISSDNSSLTLKKLKDSGLDKIFKN